MPIFDVESGKYAKLPKAFVVENGKYVALKNAFVIEGGKYVKVWSNGPAHYVAIGERGNIAISENGVSWTVGRITIDGVASDIADKMSIAYANGVYVIANRWYGSGQSIWWSTDGLNYTLATLPSVSGAYGWRVCAGKVNGTDMFVALPSQSSYPLYSYDGKTWTASSSYVRYEHDNIRFINGVFVAMRHTYAYWSSNGTYWNPITDVGSSTFHDITYAFGKYIAITEGRRLYYTTDFSGWTFPGGTGTHSVAAYVFTTDGKIIPAIGYGYASSNGQSGIYFDESLIAASTSGLTSYGTSGTGASDSRYSGITYHDKFVAVGTTGRTAYSIDGKSWTENAGNLQGNRGTICFTHVIHTANIGG